MLKCKITVLKTMFYKEFADKYVPIPDFGPCPTMKEGTVYYSGGMFGHDMPKGFCSSAWDAISKIVAVYAGGGKAYGLECNVACCNDGVRPVLFLIEPVEDNGDAE